MPMKTAKTERARRDAVVRAAQLLSLRSMKNVPAKSHNQRRMIMPKKMPKTIHAYYEQPNNGAPYLVANETADACVDLYEKRIVGVYTLKEVIEVESETKITTRKRR